MSFNNLFGNHTLYELYNGSDSTFPILNAENNWWGTTNESLIQQKIYDFTDDGTKGIVDFSPYLTAFTNDAPLTAPQNVKKFIIQGGVRVTWSANPESDIEGYKIYRNVAGSISVIDVGNVTSFTLMRASSTESISVTVYDTQADGSNDQFDGHESLESLAQFSGPDLVGTFTSLNYTCEGIRSQIKFTLDVRNVGESESNHAFRMRFFVSADDVLDTSDKFLRVGLIGKKIKSGGAVAFSGTFRLNRCSPDKKLIVFLDSTNSIFESDETNNIIDSAPFQTTALGGENLERTSLSGRVQLELALYQDKIKFIAQRIDIAELSIQVFDLHGQEVFHATSQGHQLTWEPVDSRGERFGNGVYFYIAKIKRLDAKFESYQIKKFVILR